MATSFHYMMSLKGRPCRVVDLRMVAVEELSFEAIGRFVTASEESRFQADNRQQRYRRVMGVLAGQGYARLGKAGRGLVWRYIEKVTGRSRGGP